eukprot:TRINITY_DN7842_c0_g1_i1.p1 TRINITY_DN7842_c0_g1~~TRINITY_DN7842_c0_g1_i1.p1  ORF type:complete len:177 (+),score=30.39 TRINITY_DN7842_c0_g1_i1:14-544(+)
MRRSSSFHKQPSISKSIRNVKRMRRSSYNEGVNESNLEKSEEYKNMVTNVRSIQLLLGQLYEDGFIADNEKDLIDNTFDELFKSYKRNASRKRLMKRKSLTMKEQIEEENETVNSEELLPEDWNFEIVPIKKHVRKKIKRRLSGSKSKSSTKKKPSIWYTLASIKLLHYWLSKLFG